MRFAILIMAALLAACAPSRYLTERQDAELAKACAEGCLIIPASEFQALFQALGGAGI